TRQSPIRRRHHFDSPDNRFAAGGLGCRSSSDTALRTRICAERSSLDSCFRAAPLSLTAYALSVIQRYAKLARYILEGHHWLRVHQCRLCSLDVHHVLQGSKRPLCQIHTHHDRNVPAMTRYTDRRPLRSIKCLCPALTCISCSNGCHVYIVQYGYF